MKIIDISKDLVKHHKKKFPKRRTSSIQSIAVHHSNGNGGFSSVANYHVNEKDWPGIGYAFGIHGGTIYKLNDIFTACYNVSKTNSKVIGVVIIGNYEDNRPKIQDLNALDFLVDNIRNIFGPLPVKGHQEFKATLCPGKHLMEYISRYN